MEAAAEKTMIHYHGCPISGRADAQLAYARRHAMVSFADTRSTSIVAELCQSFAIDNGAFTTWKTGKTYDIEGFAEYVREWHRHPGFDWYLMPDAIDGADEENLKLRGRWRNIAPDLWSQGVPVWHLHETLDTLATLVNAFPRIAIGSSGKYAKVNSSRWRVRMARAMKVCCDSGGVPKTKIHGLRMLDPTVFSHFPFSSADSTNVARNAGIDKKWTGSYAPASRQMRALILMERIEQHASATRWSNSLRKNEDLLG